MCLRREHRSEPMDKHGVAKQHGKESMGLNVWMLHGQILRWKLHVMYFACILCGFSCMICTCMSFPMCNNFHFFYGDTFCFHYYLTLLISKASFSALGRVQLPQDCQIRLSLVASPPLSFTPLVHITAWGVPLFENSDSFGPKKSVLSSFFFFSVFFTVFYNWMNLH